MEKCEFCSRKVLFGKKDMSNLLCARPVVLAKGEPVKRLELWFAESMLLQLATLKVHKISQWQFSQQLFRAFWLRDLVIM